MKCSWAKLEASFPDRKTETGSCWDTDSVCSLNGVITVTQKHNKVQINVEIYASRLLICHESLFWSLVTVRSNCLQMKHPCSSYDYLNIVLLSYSSIRDNTHIGIVINSYRVPLQAYIYCQGFVFSYIFNIRHNICLKGQNIKTMLFKRL